MFTTRSVLVTPLCPRKSSVTIASQENTVHKSTSFYGTLRGNGLMRFKLARLKQFCTSYATGATIRRFVTGRTSKVPEASSVDPSSSSFDDNLNWRTPGAFPFLSPNHPDCGARRRRHLSRIEWHPSAISPAFEQLSVAEQVAASPRPYFVPSTASASEVLTNVAVQDWFSTEEFDAGFYELPRHHPESNSPLLSVSDSWDSFDFVNPFERDHDATDADLDANSNLENVEGGTADRYSRSLPQAPKPTTTTGPPSQLRASAPAPLPSSVRINKVRPVISSTIEVTFRNTHSDSPRGEDNDDSKEATIIPITPFPHPHRLCTITEEDEPVEVVVVVEDSPRPETACEDQDDMDDSETIRPSSSFAF